MSKQIQIPSKIIPGENSVIYDNIVVDNNIYILHGYENSVSTNLLVLDYNTYKLKNKFNFDNCYHGIFHKKKIYVLKGHNVLAYDMFKLNLLETIDLSKFNYFDYFHTMKQYEELDNLSEEERFKKMQEDERKMMEMGIDLSTHMGPTPMDNPRGVVFNVNDLNPLNSYICILNGGLHVCSATNKFTIFTVSDNIFSDIDIEGKIYNNSSIYNDSSVVYCITSFGTYFYSSDESILDKLDDSIQNKTNMNNAKPIRLSKSVCIVNNILYNVSDDEFNELFQLPVQNLKLVQEGYKIHETNKLRHFDKIKENKEYNPQTGRYEKNEVNNENKHVVCDLLMTVSYNHLTPYNLNDYSENELSVLESGNIVGNIPSFILQKRTGLVDKVLKIPQFVNINDYLDYVQFNKIDINNVVNILNITKELNDYDNEYIAYVIAYIVYHNVVLTRNLNGQYEFLNVLYKNNIQQFYVCLSSLVFYSEEFLNKLPKDGSQLSNTILNYFKGLENYKNPGHLIN